MVRKEGFRTRGSRAIPLLILGLGLALSGALTLLITQREAEKQHALFERRVDDLEDGLNRSLLSSLNLLRGVAGLYGSSVKVDRSEFRAYLRGLNLPTAAPTLRAVGYVEPMTADTRAMKLATIRQNGVPEFRIWPPRSAPSLAPLVYIEPFEGSNREALGFDLLSNPTLARAFIRSRDEGVAIMSDRISPGPTTAENPLDGDVITILPLYRHDAPVESVEQRRGALYGWVFTAIRVTDLVNASLRSAQPGATDSLAFRIESAGREGSPEPFYVSHVSDPSLLRVGVQSSRVIRQPGGLDWQLIVTPSRDFGATRRYRWLDRLLSAAGVAMSFFLATIVHVLFRNQIRLVAAYRDSEQVHRQLHEQEALMRAIYDQTGAGIFLLCEGGRIEHANRRLAELFAVPLERLIGSDYFGLVADTDRDIARHRVMELLAGRVSFASAERCYQRGTQFFWGQDIMRPLLDGDGKIVGVVGLIADITEDKERQDRFIYLANHDPLTGLPNRNLLQDRFEQAIHHAHRQGDRVAVLFLDLDEFKPVNDHAGHAVGDRLLKAVAQRLSLSLRKSDTVARYGGDEFVVLLTEAGSGDAILSKAEQLRQALSQGFEIDGRRLQVGVSIGIALYPEDGQGINELILYADRAMYAAKQQGGNQSCRFGPDAPEYSSRVGERHG